MRYSNWIACFALGLSLAAAAPAEDRYEDRYYEGRDLRHDYRDLHYDYAAVDRLRADVARDRWRLNEDIRCGRQYRAADDAADLARDQRALGALMRDIRHDRRDIRRDWHEDNEGWR